MIFTLSILLSTFCLRSGVVVCLYTRYVRWCIGTTTDWAAHLNWLRAWIWCTIQASTSACLSVCPLDSLSFGAPWMNQSTRTDECNAGPFFVRSASFIFIPQYDLDRPNATGHYDGMVGVIQREVGLTEQACFLFLFFFSSPAPSFWF